MLVDEADITIKAGDGGPGKVSFRRAKFEPKGGPDGGNGGDGGNVYLIGTRDISALKRFRFEKEFIAQSGQPGNSAKKSGKKGQDLVLRVPIGTIIHDTQTGEGWEIINQNQRLLLALGGRGGFGNWHFRSSLNTTPTEAEPGTAGQFRQLHLELQLIADIGFIGYPSVGKSSLLNELTQAHAKTAAYHFTTLEPNLGALGDIIIADLPGLIKGAGQGKGLGRKFLRHIRRTRALIHCLSLESKTPLKDYQAIRQELADYEKELLRKPELILLTKSDLVSSSHIQKVQKTLKSTKRQILTSSIYDYDSIKKLKKVIIDLVKNSILPVT